MQVQMPRRPRQSVLKGNAIGKLYGELPPALKKSENCLFR
jgi:hypothetical protein